MPKIATKNEATAIGTRIKQLRIVQGYTQEHFARLAGVSRVGLSDIERGQSDPTPETISKIEAAFNLQLNSKEVEAALVILGREGTDK